MISSATPESTLTLSSLAAQPPAELLERAAIEQEVLALFDQFRDPLLRYVCACGFPVSDGEDLVQDVFLLLFQHLHRGGSRSNIQAWLFRVSHNLALKRRARRQREVARVDLDPHSAWFVIDPDDDPERRLIERERRCRIRSVLRALPERERQCLRLRGNGLRYRDIAKVLGISLGAVAKAMGRAVARVQHSDQR
jgi:RNA polymerase sigma-70 factor (ECF subfamily)